MENYEISLGNYVKIVAPDFDENYDKIGFIGAIIPKTRTCFSIYSFEEDQIVCFGDYLDSELMLIEKKISKDDLIQRINSKKLSNLMIDEMQKLLKSLYEV